MIISYYAVFRYENDGIDISFPDIPNAFTCAYSADEGVSTAKEVLELILHEKKNGSTRSVRCRINKKYQ